MQPFAKCKSKRWVGAPLSSESRTILATSYRKTSSAIKIRKHVIMAAVAVLQGRRWSIRPQPKPFAQLRTLTHRLLSFRTRTTARAPRSEASRRERCSRPCSRKSALRMRRRCDAKGQARAKGTRAARSNSSRTCNHHQAHLSIGGTGRLCKKCRLSSDSKYCARCQL